MTTGSTRRRTYRELCPVALALDVLGDRWCLLIVRELFAGPKRFTDMASGLTGIGSAVLTERLRELEQHGVVTRRRLRPPAPAVVYRLTSRGAALEPVLAALASWGAEYLAAGTEELESRGRWLLQAMSATAGAPPSGARTVNFVLDGEESHVAVTRGGGLEARDGLSPDARATVRGAVRQLSLLAAESDRLAPAAAHFEVEGERSAAETLVDHLVAGIHQAARRGRLQA